MSSNPCDVNTVRCAVCGKLREQANHWFLVWLTFGFHCYPFDIAPRQPDDLPVCGQACAQKEFERWMTARRNAGMELVASSLQENLTADLRGCRRIRSAG